MLIFTFLYIIVEDLVKSMNSLEIKKKKKQKIDKFKTKYLA